MRLLRAGAFVVAGLLAASVALAPPPETTTVTGELYRPDATLATGGRIVATLNQPGTVGGGSMAGQITAQIAANGTVSFAIVPNDAITPAGTYYNVEIRAEGAVVQTWTEKWRIDSAPDPVDIASIIRLDIPPGLTTGPYMQFQSSAPSGACTAAEPPRFVTATGEHCTCVASTWSCSAGGGGSQTLDQVLTLGSVSGEAMDVGFLGIGIGSDPDGSAALDIHSPDPAVAGIEVEASAAMTANYVSLRRNGGESLVTINATGQFVKEDAASNPSNRPLEFLCLADDAGGGTMPGFRFATNSTAPSLVTWMTGGFAGSTAAELYGDGQLYKGTQAGGNNYAYESLDPVAWSGSHSWAGGETLRVTDLAACAGLGNAGKVTADGTGLLICLDDQDQEGAALAPGGHHTLVILGDSIAAETPYGDVPSAGTAWKLQNLFADDPLYTVATGADLGPTTSTLSSAWNLTTGSSWTQGTETLNLVTEAVTFGYQRARGIYRPASSPFGIDISANPTDRYLLTFEVNMEDVTYLERPVTEWNPVASTASEMDYLQINVEADGCASDDWFAWKTATSTTASPALQPGHIAFAQMPWTRYAIVVDPRSWNLAADDYSASFGASTCRVEFTFDFYGSASTTAGQTVNVRNITFRRLTDSVRVIRWGYATQTTGGVAEDDWPNAKTRWFTAKPNPIDVAVLVSGRNDYDGQAGTDSFGASTVEHYADSLETLAADWAANDVLGVKMVVPPGTHQPGSVQPWSTGSFDEIYVEGFRAFYSSEREYLRRNGWLWIDTSDWLSYQEQRQYSSRWIDGDKFPNETTKDFAVFFSDQNNPVRVGDFWVYPDITTSGSNASNRYCVEPYNITTALSLYSGGATCTSTTEWTAGSRFALTVNQNLDSNGSNSAYGLRVTELGAPTSYAGGSLMVQLSTGGAERFAHQLLMSDPQHPSQLFYSYQAERIYELLAGQFALGRR